MHTCGAHVRCGVQNSPATQSGSVTQSTHWLREVSHTWSEALHCRDEVHGVGAGRQLLRVQTLPPMQSALVTQSAQKPWAVAQTWPGHMRDEAHATPATQRLAAQTGVAPEHSAPLTHCTQRPAARSQTPPPVHSRVERQGVGAMGMSAGMTASPGAPASVRASGVRGESPGVTVSVGATGWSMPVTASSVVDVSA